jgi:hypothetical protein
MKRTNRQGEWWVNNDGDNLLIVEYNGVNDCTIKFDDGTILKNIKYHNIISGGVKNNNRRSVFGVGYIGYGKHKASIKSKHTKCYSIWRGMLQRCYYQYKDFNVSYKDVVVCQEWHNFQNFAEWFEENYIDGWQLDKDLLSTGYKVYSPITCCFIPQEINCLIKEQKKTAGTVRVKDRYKSQIGKNKVHNHIGSFDSLEDANKAYKEEKKKYILNIAEQYKDKININVYNKLINYEVQNNHPKRRT